jgi:hypothetical protein
LVSRTMVNQLSKEAKPDAIDSRSGARQQG